MRCTLIYRCRICGHMFEREGVQSAVAHLIKGDPERFARCEFKYKGGAPCIGVADIAGSKLRSTEEVKGD